VVHVLPVLSAIYAHCHQCGRPAHLPSMGPPHPPPSLLPTINVTSMVLARMVRLPRSPSVDGLNPDPPSTDLVLTFHVHGRPAPLPCSFSRPALSMEVMMVHVSPHNQRHGGWQDQLEVDEGFGRGATALGAQTPLLCHYRSPCIPHRRRC
jgi:hypothetical protein